jgi:AcrR family transcriptional regulator
MPHDMTPEEPEPNQAHRPADLRQRRRIRTKQLVQREALRLFADKGFDQTTVDDIAHAAAMSPRTFFRYFPSKEDVVLWDEYDEPAPQEVLFARLGENPYATMILRAREVLADLYRQDPDLLLARVKLSFTVPEIRARFFNQQMVIVGPAFERLADAFGGDRDDLRLPVTLAALYSAMLVAAEHWQRHDGREDLLELFDRAIGTLAAGAADLRDAVAGATPGAHSPERARSGQPRRA